MIQEAHHTKPRPPLTQHLLHAATNATSTAKGFRFWVDYHAFRNGTTALYEEALEALGAENAVDMDDDEDEHEEEEDDDEEVEDEAADSHDNSNHGSVNGFDNIGSWDVYLTGARQLSMVWRRLKPGQLVCYQAGSGAVAAKSRLVPTLQAHYGHAVAGEFVPVSFKLPGEVSKWQEWIQQHTDQVSTWAVMLQQQPLCSSRGGCNRSIEAR